MTGHGSGPLRPITGRLAGRLPVLLLIGAALSPAVDARRLAAQERPDSVAPPVRDTLDADTLDDAGADGTAAAAPARPPYEPPRLAFSVSFGTLGIGALQSQPVRADRILEDGMRTDTLRRDIDAGVGIHVSVSALLGLSPAWAARVGLGYGRATLEADYSGDDDLVEEARGLPSVGDAGIELILWEAALRFRIPSSRRLQPYAELGVGGVRWSGQTDDGVFPGAASLTRTRSGWGPMAALGGDIPLLPGVSARIQASTRIVRTPLAPAPAGAAVAQGDSLTLTFAAPADGLVADPTHEITSILRLEAGLSLELGRIRRPDPSRPAPAASGSDSRR